MTPMFLGKPFDLRQYFFEDAEKPTTMSADDAGTKPDNNVGSDDTEKQKNGMEADAAPPAPTPPPAPMGGMDNGMGGPGGQPAAPPVPNNFRQQIDIGKIVYAPELRRALDHPITQQFVIGETVRVVSVPEFENFLAMETPEGEVKNGKWLLRMSDQVLKLIKHIQHLWFWKTDNSPVFNALINAIAKGPPHATVFVNTALERGRRVDIDDLDEFFKPMRIGETLDMPPSGFSTIPYKARKNANPRTPDEAGVLIRLFPNPMGELHGVHLHREEVIRTEGPLARVAGVTKFIVVRQGQYVKSLIVVDLEDQGYEDDVLQLESVRPDLDLEEKYPVYCEYMNTSFRAIYDE